MSLRARLLIVTVLVAAFGIGAVALITRGELRSFLTQRVDDQLTMATRFSTGGLTPIVPGGGLRVPRGLPNDAYGQLLDDTNKVTQTYPFGPDAFSVPHPVRIPSGVLDKKVHTFTATAPVTGAQFRVQVSPLPGGGHLAIATPFKEVDATVSRLDRVLLIVSLLSLLIVALAAALLVRFGLRPLSRMGQTADRIAAGDLTQRVSPDESRTEIGKLGHSLNRMLGQIEEGYREREESAARLQQFVADASHELKTPLTSIRGYAELFRRGAADNPDDLAMVMARIEAESIRMGGLVEDLLLLAKLDEGTEPRHEPVDLGYLARDAVADARAAAPDHHVLLDGPDDDGAIVALGDENRLRQVLANLLMNATTHTPPGTTVHVTVGRDADAAILRVADDGPGIPPELAERVFERFYRADASRTRATGGSGLGLSIVASIVEGHAGTVAVESTETAGTTFTVRIPCAPNGSGELAAPPLPIAGY
ncbi:MAG: histidine kinase [Actinomycetia bacterium]|nr:histidine kinase [Actinomycetes bacterium]